MFAPWRDPLVIGIAIPKLQFYCGSIASDHSYPSEEYRIPDCTDCTDLHVYAGWRSACESIKYGMNMETPNLCPSSVTVASLVVQPHCNQCNQLTGYCILEHVVHWFQWYFGIIYSATCTLFIKTNRMYFFNLKKVLYVIVSWVTCLIYLWAPDENTSSPYEVDNNNNNNAYLYSALS